MSLLWRVDSRIRATADVDANWRADETDLEAFLDHVTACELNDGFTFDIGDARPLQGDTQGGFRYRVLASMAGREFERFHLDINLASDDARAVDQLPVQTAPMAFADVQAAQLTVPVISLAQQFAEKLHATARTYSDDRPSTRAKDAFDTVATARLISVPNSRELIRACHVTFTRRGDQLPATLPEVPGDWYAALDRLLAECPLPIADSPTQLHTLYTTFWQPLLHEPHTPARHFDSHTWTWRPER